MKVALLLVPGLTSLGVLVLLLWFSVPQVWSGVRVWGWAAPGASEVVLRVEGRTHRAGQEQALADQQIVVKAEQAAHSQVLRIDLDAEGQAEVVLPRVGEVFRLQVEAAGAGAQPLAVGSISLTSTHPVAEARRRGGLLAGQQTGRLQLRVAPGRGAFAVPFVDPLWVEVSHAGRVLAEAHVALELEGARGVGPQEKVTSSAGTATFLVAPQEHTVFARVYAKAAGVGEGQLEFHLPVVPGAGRAELQSGAVRVASAVPREVLFLTIVDAAQRWQGARVALTPSAEGIWEGLVPLRRGMPASVWAVVSSDPNGLRDTTVGWPLFETTSGVPAQTLDVADKLWVDGMAQAQWRAQQRQHRAALLAVALCAASFFVSMGLMRRVNKVPTTVTLLLALAYFALAFFVWLRLT